LDWIDVYGDADGDGFVEYGRKEASGLINQGWKDSFDSIFHEDGRLAEGPIALCEVQAYVFAAKQAACRIATALGDSTHAAKLADQANALQRLFEEKFWDETLGTYVLALDGQKNPCRVLASNAGHALFAGMADTGRAARVSQALLSSAFFSGWGIRTVAIGQSRYNPISYHNGSVWPHDNALIAVGLGRYGRGHLAARVLTSLFAAATHAGACVIRGQPAIPLRARRRPGPPAPCQLAWPHAWVWVSTRRSAR
jgi:glycogen debranching enzyme